MKIFINGRFLAAPVTGVQRVARQLIRHLDIQLNKHPGDFEWVLVHPTHAPYLNSLTAIETRALRGPSGLLWEQFSLVRATRTGVLVNLANTGPLSGRRSIVMIHDAQVFDAPNSYSPAFRLWYRMMLPRICGRALQVLTVSRHSAGRLAANGVISDEAAAVVVSNGVDHILEAEAASGTIARMGLDNRPFVLAFASDQPHKNTALLLELASKLEPQGLALALVGSRLPPGARPLHNARLLGKVSDADLRALYEACFAFLMPSLTEGFGLPAGEAMMCGAPVIISDSAALAEMWGEGALTAGSSSVDSWLRAIDTLSVSQAAREARGKAGRAHASRFTWDAAAEQLRHEVETVAARLSLKP